MESSRRQFLCFLPWLVVAPKIVTKVFLNSTPIIGADYSELALYVGGRGGGKSFYDVMVANELARISEKLPALFDRDSAFFTIILSEGVIPLRKDVQLKLFKADDAYQPKNEDSSPEPED